MKTPGIIKIPGLLIALAATILVCAFAGTESGNRHPADREIGELRDQVNEMRARVRFLEERLSRLESTEDRLKQGPAESQTPVFVPKGPPSILRLPSAGQPQPEIWDERQINGWTFYVIPCEMSSNLPASTTVRSR